MSPLKMILLVIIASIVVLLAINNMDTVEISYFDFYFNFHNIKVPLLIVIFGAMAFGFSIAWISGWISQIKYKAQINRKDKTIEELQSQLNEYRPPAKPTPEITSSTTPTQK